VSAPQDERSWHAANYCRDGLRLLPTINKFPPRGFKWKERASSDYATVKRWLQQWPGCDLAVALPAHIVVVDLDPREKCNGYEQLLRIAQVRPDDIDTIQYTTRSGGRHLWFDADGHTFSNRTGRAALAAGHPGLDIKTEVGYVVVPPAVGRRWLPRDYTRAPAPSWLKQLFPEQQAHPSASYSYASKVEASVAREHSTAGLAMLLLFLDQIRTAPVGTRGSTRNACAYAIGGLVGGGELEENSAWDALVDASREQNDPRFNIKHLRNNSFDKGRSKPWRCNDYGLGDVSRLEASEGISFEEIAAAIERSTS
jgi:hypothetical protein